jgi:hypothetical protein
MVHIYASGIHLVRVTTDDGTLSSARTAVGFARTFPRPASLHLWRWRARPAARRRDQTIAAKTDSQLRNTARSDGFLEMKNHL